MTDIEKKALALWGPGVTAEVNLHNFSILGTAFLEMRDRHEAFRREVSDAIAALKKDVGTGWDHCRPAYACNRFIIAKPDPLVVEAREICARVCEGWVDIPKNRAAAYRDGVHDDEADFAYVLNALRKANAARRIETERAVADEIARITSWLKAHGMRQIANSIERGDYK